jgi:DNA-binding Xre family transcriptional regulator
LIVADTKLQIFGDLSKGLSPFCLALFHFLSDTTKSLYNPIKKCIFAFKINIFAMNALNRIKVVLVEQKKTGKWLSEQLGVNVATTSRWCSNVTQPDLQTLDKIAKLLDVDVKDLLNSTEKKVQ